MLLTIDVGNTNITMGVFDGQDLLGNFRVTTKINRTSDEFGIVIKEILRSNDLDANKIDDVIIASVVPNVMHSLTSSIIKYFDIQPIIVEAGIKTGIRIATENPKQIGADRIVDAAGAFELYGGPVLVLDFVSVGYLVPYLMRRYNNFPIQTTKAAKFLFEGGVRRFLFLLIKVKF